jgi:hypothetical protein
MPDQGPPRVTFRIGDVLPADDVVARFLTGVALSTNDLIRVQSYVVVEQDVAKQLFLFRQNASYVWETAIFVRDSRRLAAVDAFVTGLPETARGHLARAMDGVLAPDQTDFGRDLAFIRNHAFHYPELQAGTDDLQRALDQVADTEGAISGRVVEEFRFDFADDVAVRLLSRDAGFVVEELADVVAEFPIRTEAFRMFADEAFAAYLGAPERRRHLR